MSCVVSICKYWDIVAKMCNPRYTCYSQENMELVENVLH